MHDFWKKLFDANVFLPQVHCYLENAGLVRLHLLSEVAIGAADLAISITVVCFLWRSRRAVPFSWMFLAFGVFIPACGVTHLMEVWTLWTPLYWLSGIAQLVTAAASVTIAVVLPFLIPPAFAFLQGGKTSARRQMDLEARDLEARDLQARDLEAWDLQAKDLEAKDLQARVAEMIDEVRDRKEREAEIQSLNAEMGKLVARRTAELANASQEVLRMTAMMDNSIEAIVSLDLNHLITGWNKAAERMFGYAAEEVLGCPVSILSPPSLVSETAEKIDRYMRGEGPGLFESVRVRKDGGEIDVNEMIFLVRDGAGIIQGSSLIKRDITERRSSLEVVRLAVDAAPQAMVMADEKGRIALVNSETERLFGYTRAELLGQSVDLLVPTRFRRGHPKHRQEYMADPHPRSMGAGRELYGLRKDGVEFPVEIRLNPIRVPEGTWVLSAIVDITERKRTSDMLRLAVEAAPNAMVMADETGRIVLVNSETERLFGYTRQELLGRNIDSLQRTAANGELYGLRKDGAEFPVEIGRNPIEVPQGTWVLNAIVDITERKRALLEMVALRTRELTVANQELEAFSYSVAHDLRAPLRHIAGFATLLMEEHRSELSVAAQKHLRILQDGAQHMGSMIDHLLRLAKIGRKPLSFDRAPMNELVTAAIAGLAADSAGRKIEWRIGPLGHIHCDTGLMLQVLANLLSNAVKYTRRQEAAVIEVLRTTGEHGEPVFEVRDNGAGFDMEYAGRLFGVFQRLHKPQDFEGDGVGLATVQRIVNHHGGRVWAYAEPDKGASFYFTLPDAGAAASQLERATVGGDPFPS
jgi:PAS domain S-box-containing protein